MTKKELSNELPKPIGPMRRFSLPEVVSDDLPALNKAEQIRFVNEQIRKFRLLVAGDDGLPVTDADLAEVITRLLWLREDNGLTRLLWALLDKHAPGLRTGLDRRKKKRTRTTSRVLQLLADVKRLPEVEGRSETEALRLLKDKYDGLGVEALRTWISDERKSPFVRGMEELWA